MKINSGGSVYGYLEKYTLLVTQLCNGIVDLPCFTEWIGVCYKCINKSI